MDLASLRARLLFDAVFLALAFLALTYGQQAAPLANVAATAMIDWNALDRAYLRRLRETYHLDEVIARADNDYERVLAVCRWVRSRWEHNGSNEPRRSDPIAILEEAAQGKSFRCVEYAIVLSGALNAIGIRARVLALKTADVETRESGAGHVVAEAFLPDQKKWLMVDGQWDVIPLRAGEPLNAHELGQALARQDGDIDVDGISGTTREQYLPWIAPYLYYLDINLKNPMAGGNSRDGGLMLLPEGARKPTTFQRRWPLDYLTYTTSVETFYQAPIDLDALAREIVGDAERALEKCERIVAWTNRQLAWTVTDYQSRNVTEIVARKRGNCSEQVLVARALLDRVGVETRRVAEINLQPESERRQNDAAALVKSRGLRCSVFGSRHNDHRWIEVHDAASGTWIPADPSLGLLGEPAWLRARVSFAPRPTDAILLSRDMIVPIAIYAVDDGEQRILEDRTEHYLADGLRSLYPALAVRESFARWVALLRELGPRAEGALLGKIDLHESAPTIASLAQAYETLRREAVELGLIGS
ncbi:MAG: transglutaminase-like domain-containing protein [Planctomycetota bacterium]